MPEPSPRFESLAFAVEPGRRKDSRQAARRALRAAFRGERWALEALPATRNEFLARLRPPGGRRRSLSQQAAWERVYRLRDQPQVVYAEPLFTIVDETQHRPPALSERQRVEGTRRGRTTRSAGTDVDPRTAGRYEWPLERMRVRQAWDAFDGRTPGSGVLVGHPDTGYTRHPEIDGPRLRTDLGYDYEDRDTNARDPLATGFMRNPGHGTGTASVIMSGVGKPPGWPDEEFVSGTAPGAALVPIRTTKSVVLWSMERLVLAIHHAIQNRCHIVSISLGGVAYSMALHNAVKAAERDGVIVLCAAGNQVRFVVFPAAFDEVVAVAASDIADEPWIGSCRGPAVDITAPGHSVYRARTTEAGGREDYAVERGSGTSFAVAATAGVASLWLSFHGRSALTQRYGKDRLSAVFKQLLQQTCRTPGGWNAGDFGPGIVHAQRLVEAALPRHAPARGMRGLARRPVSVDDLPLETVVHLLAPAPRSGIERTLADLLAVDEDQLPALLQDVGAELAFRIGVDPALRERLVAAASSRRATRGGRAARRAPNLAAVRRSLSRSSSRRLRKTVHAR